jgi:hypothetical protein
LAEGGITNGSIFANIGEAGREAVLPLDRNTGWMDQLANKINPKTNGSATYNFEIKQGDININGSADTTAVTQIRKAQKDNADYTINQINQKFLNSGGALNAKFLR